MPSSPKRTPKTGSVLLGQELRRLRGGRILREICDLTRTPPLSTHVAPIAEASLCEIESGKTMPSLGTLHALSVVYKTSMSQLMAYVTEEKLAGALKSPLDAAETRVRFASLLAEGKWHEALLAALCMEHQADNESARLAWRGNRASCLARIGLVEEAVALFTECCESSALTAPVRLHTLRNLASCHVAAGNEWMAELILRDARALAERIGASPAELATLDVLTVELILSKSAAGFAQEERTLRAALRSLEGAMEHWPTTDTLALERMALERAQLHLCLGNKLLAARDAARVLASASKAGNALTIARAHDTLAMVRLAQNRIEDAIAAWESAARVADADSQHDLAFEASFRLFLLLKESRPGRATQCLLRCKQIFPLLSVRTPLVRQFEEFSRARQ